MLDTLIIADLLALGAVGGTLAGLLGVGGGIVIVPALLWLFAKWQLVPAEQLMQFALGTSLATICFTSISSVWAHQKHGAILWREVFHLSPGLIVGTLLGAHFACMLSTQTLTLFFATFLLVASAQMALGLQPKATRKLPTTLGASVIGLLIGVVSSLVGIGGGTLTVPILMWCNVPIRKAVATSSAGGIFISIAGTIGFMISASEGGPDGQNGFVYWPIVTWIVIPSLLFVPLGAKLAHSLPVGTLKRFFALFLSVVGVKLLSEHLPDINFDIFLHSLIQAREFMREASLWIARESLLGWINIEQMIKGLFARYCQLA